MIRHSASRTGSAALVSAAGVLTLALLAAPLPFGSIVPAAATGLRLAGFVALGLAAFSLTPTPRGPLRDRSRGSTPVPWLPVLALAAFYLWRQLHRRAYAMRFTNVDLLRTVAPKGLGWRRHVPATAFLLCLLVLRGCLKRVFPWPLFAATVSPAGPVGSTLGLEYLARRRRRRRQPA